MHGQVTGYAGGDEGRDRMMKPKIKIVDLIRAEGREPGGVSTVTIWSGRWGEPMRRLPDDGKPHGLTLLGLSERRGLTDEAYKALADVLAKPCELLSDRIWHE